MGCQQGTLGCAVQFNASTLKASYVAGNGTAQVYISCDGCKCTGAGWGAPCDDWPDRIQLCMRSFDVLKCSDNSEITGSNKALCIGAEDPCEWRCDYSALRNEAKVVGANVRVRIYNSIPVPFKIWFDSGSVACTTLPQTFTNTQAIGDCGGAIVGYGGTVIIHDPCA